MWYVLNDGLFFKSSFLRLWKDFFFGLGMSLSKKDFLSSILISLSYTVSSSMILSLSSNVSSFVKVEAISVGVISVALSLSSKAGILRETQIEICNLTKGCQSDRDKNCNVHFVSLYIRYTINSDKLQCAVQLLTPSVYSDIQGVHPHHASFNVTNVTYTGIILQGTKLLICQLAARLIFSSEVSPLDNIFQGVYI